METIVLSDDEEDAAPRTGLCIHCGQVSKPHACPHGTVKIMKPLSKSKCAHRHAISGPSMADLIPTIDEGASSASAAPPPKRMKAPRRK